MTYQFPPKNWPDSDPAPNVPTLAEIQLAEELRHHLELRLLSAIDVPTRDAPLLQRLRDLRPGAFPAVPPMQPQQPS